MIEKTSGIAFYCKSKGAIDCFTPHGRIGSRSGLAKFGPRQLHSSPTISQDADLHCHIIISSLKFMMPRTAEDIELTTTVINQSSVEAITQNDDISPSSRPWNTESESDITGQALAPADGGPAAWRLLLAAFVFEALLWGDSLSEVATNVLG
jgi:hypothetical protein